MNQYELKALLGKTVRIRGDEHFCCAVGNDRLLLLQYAAKVTRCFFVFPPCGTATKGSFPAYSIS